MSARGVNASCGPLCSPPESDAIEGHHQVAIWLFRNPRESDNFSGSLRIVLRTAADNDAFGGHHQVVMRVRKGVKQRESGFDARIRHFQVVIGYQKWGIHLLRFVKRPVPGPRAPPILYGGALGKGAKRGLGGRRTWTFHSSPRKGTFVLRT